MALEVSDARRLKTLEDENRKLTERHLTFCGKPINSSLYLGGSMLHKTSLLIFAILISMGAFADEQTSASRICNKAREYGYQTKNALNGVYGTQRKYDLGCLYLGLFAANMEELRAVFIANKDFSKDVFNEAHDLYLRVMNLTPYCGMNVIFSRYTETMPIRRHDATELLRQLNEIMPRSDELQVAVDRLTK